MDENINETDDQPAPAHSFFLPAILIVLSIPGLLAFWPASLTNDTGENRTSAPLPTIPASWTEYKTFPTRFQMYVADHFGFRNLLLGTQHRLQYHFWGSPTLDPPGREDSLLNQATAANLSNDVLIGRDGWLFFKGDRLLDDARGLRPFSPDELQKWTAAFQHNHMQLARRGIRYLVVFVPNKATVYPEHLPREITFSESSRRLPQLINSLQSQTDVDVLDLTTPLREAKSKTRLYHRTDTHWNEAGAYLGLHLLMQQLDHAPRNLPSLDEIRFIESSESGKDLARMSGLDQVLYETVIRLHPDDLPLAEGAGPKYGTYFSGMCHKYDNGSDSPGLGHVALYHDSFGLEWLSWLSQECSELTSCWSFTLELEKIQAEQPDLVIHQIVERMLPVRKPEELFTSPDRR